MKKIRFIINPKSGAGKKENFVQWIKQYTDPKKAEAEISYTEAPNHATVLAKEASDKGFDIVVAVGGDGSVNETASALVNSQTALGIIPTGSGNGMARHMKIPLNFGKAVSLLNDGRIETIDTVTVNEHFCIGTIGVGFDAHIAHLFARAGKRGYSTYVKLVLAEFSKFEKKHFSILVDGKQYERDCFLLTFANSSQFGNNAVIAPFADVQDGLIEISMISKFPSRMAPVLIYRMMNNIIHKSKFFDSLRGKNIVVKNNGELAAHIDGEPLMFNSDLTIKVNPLSLKIVVPQLVK